MPVPFIFSLNIFYCDSDRSGEFTTPTSQNRRFLITHASFNNSDELIHLNAIGRWFAGGGGDVEGGSQAVM
ncbi:hypothetical protein MTR_1g041065 [Medicago truncatula]|uniref:Uncharacterized protein n=1 Tax=Medicago truncatula TaxID=3880 RepID=G7ZY94_MEDTR|nr:hypothetical protein MTR_1g041065 [Medicago truncatula]